MLLCEVYSDLCCGVWCNDVFVVCRDVWCSVTRSVWFIVMLVRGVTFVV